MKMVRNILMKDEAMTENENSQKDIHYSKFSFESKRALLKLEIEPEGLNLSQGQRQLVCITRALIKRPKVLLMDEATANIDKKTDQLIQNILKERLGKCSLLTIAHRVETLIDYDRIIVMDEGEIVESGAPSELYKLDGYFTSLADESGLSDFFKKDDLLMV